jgi:O-antigen/teichoic acid export membrane protein
LGRSLINLQKSIEPSHKGTTISKQRRFLRSGAVLIAGQVISQGTSVLRNIVIARLILTEADFGIASTLILIVAMSEMLSNLAINAFVVQDKDGDEPHFLSVVHFVTAVRAIVGASVLFFFASPLAKMFGIPQATWALSSLALIPLLRGVNHLDIYRFQRKHSFLPGVVQECASQVLTLAYCFPMFRYVNDYSAVIFLLILQTAIVTLVSHAVSTTPYRWARDPLIEKRLFAFGLPLMMGGIMVFLIFQGERFVIGSAGRLFPGADYSLDDMAAYSAAYMVAAASPFFFSRVLANLFMPILAHGDEREFLHYNTICVQLSTLIGGAVMIPIIIGSGTIVRLIFGDRYSLAGPLLTLIAVEQALRILRMGAMVALNARGYTWETFFSDALRSSVFPGIVLVAFVGLPLVWIPVPAIAGELIAISALSWQLSKRCSIPPANTLGPLALLVTGLGAAHVLRFLFGGKEELWYFVLGFGVWIGFFLIWGAFCTTTVGIILRFISGHIRKRVSAASV